MTNDIETELITRITANIPTLQIVSADIPYIKEEIAVVSEKLGRKVYFWSFSEGIQEAGKNTCTEDTEAKPAEVNYSSPKRLPASEIDQDEKVAEFWRAYTAGHMADTPEIFKPDSETTAKGVFRGLSHFIRHKREKQTDENPMMEITIGSEDTVHYSEIRTRAFSGVHWAEHAISKLLEPEMQNSILVMENISSSLNDEISSDMDIMNALKQVARARMNDRTLIMIQSERDVPKDLRHDIVVIDCRYPDAGAIRQVMDAAAAEFHLSSEQYQPCRSLINAALGLTTGEARNAYASAIVQSGHLTKNEVPLILAVKKDAVAAGGILQYCDAEYQPEDVGGLDLLKEWIQRHKVVFEPEAAAYGLKAPRGLLLLGPPGTGKSLAAKTVARDLGFPMVQLDFGRVFGKYVGTSEENMRNALAAAESISPCVLWVDEIEKALAGNKSSEVDHGVTERIFGTFITWMQDRKAPVFIVATANNVGKLPIEILRKGRFDEIFFVDLPTKDERKDIFAIHLKRCRKELFCDEDMNLLADISQGYSGAEIEAAVNEANLTSYMRDKILRVDDVRAAILATPPLSERRKDELNQCREIAKTCAVPASSKQKDAARDGGNYEGVEIGVMYQ